eukprot:CAMPEP_0201136666 /NCGR_PEP_ID=MMETSP0850-20130426/55004_1 /ASSEMBLY_ACC=CAM_ASM_000622 /TAXON_ID=183588 /ORGANISM="Pseudo-nitzschia fraudulenta, Strain WWA7" /LENGTH=574 /DNA_ID=CAMNT_0047407981 /DNA_START=166 /DNA_END=1890 /DNA_ORIENTATION=-
MAAATAVTEPTTEGGSMQTKNRAPFRFLSIAAVACFLAGAAFYSSNGSNGNIRDNFDAAGLVQRDLLEASSTGGEVSAGMARLLSSEESQEDLLIKIAKKLKPTPLLFFGEGEEESEQKAGDDWSSFETVSVGKKGELYPKMLPHQFLHLHHMKTGGTSIDQLLRCGMNRLRRESKYNIPYFSIHECSRQRFADCLADKNNYCRPKMESAAVMSYCSALKYLDEFGWWKKGQEEEESSVTEITTTTRHNHKVKAFTVLRHPVERVWSMFRFQTKNCFKCHPLKDLYEKYDMGEDTGLDDLCLNQLLNHETNNLLSSHFPVKVDKLDPENDPAHQEIADNMVAEAIDNMKGFFTVIGITEELVETSKVLGSAFPWMALEGNVELYNTTLNCTLAHANKSPSNNRCGEGNTHWALGDHPDEETRAIIEKHNFMDMKLYESAVAYFELQKQAVGMIDDLEDEADAAEEVAAESVGEETVVEESEATEEPEDEETEEPEVVATEEPETISPDEEPDDTDTDAPEESASDAPLESASEAPEESASEAPEESASEAPEESASEEETEEETASGTMNPAER